MAMFRYSVAYRFYTLAKLGFCAAYLWYTWDFFCIHAGYWGQPFQYWPDASQITFSGNVSLDAVLRPAAVFQNGKPMVWALLDLAPVAAGLFLWGRHKWLQVLTGGWMSFSMISLSSLAGVFSSTGDIWVNYVFVAYWLSALICPTAEWEQREPGFSLSQWQVNPVFTSNYAWLVVVIEFTVYFFAGINKLVFGWTPWISGTALQNLAYDSSMHEFAQGVHVPLWISFVLCYYTLFQRLVVPFGFFSKRFRTWTVLILGSMHIGYAILMKVAIFPVIGLASLMMVLPPKPLEFLWPFRTIIVPKTKKKPAPEKPTSRWAQVVTGAFCLWLLLEPVRLVHFPARAWENKFMLVPMWRMFADGGVNAGGHWRLILETPHGEVDATQTSLQMLPHVWRDRFYIDLVYHELLNKNSGPGSLPEKLAEATEKAYSQHQVQLNANPEVLGSGFDVLSRNSQP